MLNLNLSEITADSGYCSEKNLKYLKENKIKSYIKLQEYEKKKTRKYYQQIGKHYNMEKVEILDSAGSKEIYYKCHANRKLELTRIETSITQGFTRNYRVYESNDCGGCLHKSECLYRYDEEKDINKNKMMKINEDWEELKKESEKNVLSEKGIKNQQIRSIQTEGHFGDMRC